ncbi:MAG TPA: DinB family protein [Thermoanaerobaculia bacterium]|nr:DinB family protein [Thermoanaerobaculia bacterium]
MPQVRRRPARDEADSYYYRYIDRIDNDDVLAVLESQLAESARFLGAIAEEKTLHSYAPGKWTIRQVVNHISDCERLFVGRAFWFARGFDSVLPSFSSDLSAEAAGANGVAWKAHLEEFDAVRRSTLSFFRNLPDEAWDRTGKTVEYPFTVRSLAYIAAGHFDHHRAILQERYL